MAYFYDLQKVKEISGGDISFVKAIVETFIKEIPPDMEALQIAIDNENHQMAYQFAHKMKPNIDLFGVDVLKQLKSIEKWSKTDRSASYIKPKLDKIVIILTAVLKELRVNFSLQ